MSESAEHLLNQGPVNADQAPTEPYVEMPSAQPPEPKRKEYSGEAEGLQEAARDLDKARAAEIPKAEAEPIDRGYKWISGEKAGEPVDPRYTLTPERASMIFSNYGASLRQARASSCPCFWAGRSIRNIAGRLTIASYPMLTSAR
jgi:hypothetical protein